MKTVSKQAICTAHSGNIPKFIERPFMDCAGIDADYDSISDEEREIINGILHHDRAHGDETCNTLGDRWNSLQAFMGAAS